jgi:DNA repair exonuclease SbcCD ATPase subunit
MKLISIEIFPNGISGWQSGLLEFGSNVTQLFGANGCGKTPIVQSIAYCLGYPSIFRNDIYERCNHVILKVSSSKGNLIIKRVYSKSIDIEIIEQNGKKERFFDEKEYSAYLFELLELKVENLVTTNNKSTSPYLSSILPIYYLDQDDGYNKFYSPPSNFIKDQFSEMMRMIFNLPIKNSFNQKKEKFKAKERLDYLDKQVELHARRAELAKQEAALISKNSDELAHEITTLESEIEQLKSSGANHDDSINVLDRLIAKHRTSIRSLSNEISEINKRTNGIAQITHEINTEIETLNLNEEARRVFLSFNEICGSNQCQLFSSSSDTYSKNLLYLKDQIKDLERNAEIDKIKVEQIELQRKGLEELVQSIIDERNISMEKSEVSALVDAISELKNQIFEVQSQKSDIEKVELLENKHFKSISERNKALEKYQSFGTEKNSIPALLKLKSDLRQLLLNWLEELNTNNISRNITFKDDFTPFLGTETISQLKGSTRTRAVLAYHAALIELMAKHDSFCFRFLILDTPKQHEIHNDDLNRYIEALKTLCNKHNIQVIFSTTEYHYEGDDNDIEWNPKFAGEKQLMFMKSNIIPTE